MAVPDALTAVAAALVLRDWARPATDPAANAADAARANREDQPRSLHNAHSAQKGALVTHSPNDAATVEIRLAGHLDPHWSTWLGGFTLTHGTDATTTLRGHVADQAQLHGLLQKIRDMGVTLISLTQIDPANAGCDDPLDPSSGTATGQPRP